MNSQANTCEKAFAELSKYADKVAETRLFINRIAAPAGTISDGTRQFLVAPCPRHRWLIVKLGFETVAEIDQRDFWDEPEEMARAVMQKIEERAENGRGKQ
jgi:hypothetical protein